MPAVPDDREEGATVKEEGEVVADIHITSVATCCGLALSSSMERTWAATECSVAKATTAVPALCYCSSPLICLKQWKKSKIGENQAIGNRK